MSVFQKVVLSWNGQDYTIESDKVLGAIAVVEEHFTILQLLSSMTENNIKVAKLSQCVADVLRYAGAVVSDDEVYQGMFKVGETAEQIQKSILTLVMMVIPPDELAKMELPDEVKQMAVTPGKPKRRTRQPVTKSSRRSTKR